MTIREHNMETNIVTDREMTAKELVDHELQQAAESKAASQKASDKAALLNTLGITEDEARLLLG